MNEKRTRLFVCAKGKKCAKRGSDEVLEAIVTQAQSLELDCQIIPTKCLGMCKHAPAIVVLPGKVKHRRVDPEDALHILKQPFEPTKGSKKKKKKKKKK